MTRRIDSKGRVTSPASVRNRLKLKPGDTVAFDESEGGTVVLRKRRRLDVKFLFQLERALCEWNSKSDDRAYADL